MKLLIFASLVAFASAACPNDCAGHGVCGLSTQCECYRNWYGADCSERICSYGLAFVDSPIGDLNGDGAHDASRMFDPRTTTVVHGIDGVVGGASELYAWQYGYARSDRTGEWDEAHFYRECSNKGNCDRATGVCDCFPGYEGEGCVRTSCPSDCSGHGQCRTIDDSGSDGYSAWDLHHTQLCVCDAGYSGPDCSQRDCPRGADPVENALVVTNSVQGIFWRTFYAEAANNEAEQEFMKDKPSTVFYTLTFTDEYGDEWVTNLLTIQYSTSCDGTNCLSTPVLDEAEAENYAEAVNNSIGALPLNVVENHYVWIEGQSWGSDGANSGTVSYPHGATDPASVSVDALEYRLDSNIVPAGCNDAADITFSTTSDDAFGLCFFVQVSNPGVQEAMQVKYWYNPGGDDSAGNAVGFHKLSGATTAFHDGADYNEDPSEAIGIVTVDNLQGDRVWNDDDGDVALDFMQTNANDLHVCAKRGVCDYDTGVCDCFSGYSGVRCDDQNAIAYSY